MDINLLKNSKTNSMSFLTKAMEPKAKVQWEADPRIWLLKGDDLGNGSATIRFLPSVEGDKCELPFVKVFSHSFKGPGGWYIENCRSTLNELDPVNEEVQRLWTLTDQESITRRGSWKRRTNYYSNILVISDLANPENNGKVFVFKYGKSIYDMIVSKMNPIFADEEPINVFDLWEGCNFRFKMIKKDGFANYDQSSFSNPSPIADSSEKILDIMKTRYDLSEYIDPSQFKSYENLALRFKKVIGIDREEETYTPTSNLHSTPAPTRKSVEPKELPFTADDVDDALEYFKSLAGE